MVRVQWIDLIDIIEFIFLIQKFRILSHSPRRTQILLQLLEIVLPGIIILLNLFKPLRDIISVNLVMQLLVVLLETSHKHMFLQFKIMLHSGGALLSYELFDGALDSVR